MLILGVGGRWLTSSGGSLGCGASALLGLDKPLSLDWLRMGGETIAGQGSCFRRALSILITSCIKRNLCFHIRGPLD